MLEEAQFSVGQKMMMLDHQSANNIHMAIKDAVNQKADHLYEFMLEQMDRQS